MWVQLGTVQISNYEWVLFEPPLVYGLGFDVGLFRISHDWHASLSPHGGGLWIGSYFPIQDSWALMVKSFPYKQEPKIISSPVPGAYLQAGFYERVMAIKPDNRCRWYESSNWTVTLEYFAPDVPTEDELFRQHFVELEAGQLQILERLRRLEERV